MSMCEYNRYYVSYCYTESKLQINTCMYGTYGTINRLSDIEYLKQYILSIHPIGNMESLIILSWNLIEA